MPRVLSPQVHARRLALARVVRARRTSLGLTQVQLAQRVGCDRQTINRIENAVVSPSLDTCFAVADALDAPLADLVAAVDRHECE